MRKCIVDIEANGLEDVTKIWCLVARDIATGEVFKFHPKKKVLCPTCSGTGLVEGHKCPYCFGECYFYYGHHNEWKDEFLEFVKEVDTWIGHNLIGYDIYVMNKLLGTEIKIDKVVDTLVLSRLFRPVSPIKNKDDGTFDNRHGGHSLGAWGDRLGFPKIKFDDFTKFSMSQLKYCEQDTLVNLKVHEVLEKESNGFSDLSIRLEHNVAWLLRQQERNGFYLDQEEAKKLLKITGDLLDEMLENLQKLFPPVKKVVRNWTPTYVDAPVYQEYEHTFKSGQKAGQTVTRRRAVKGPDGFQLKERKLSKVSEKIFKNWLYEPLEDGSYDLYIMQDFNPGSSKQMGERLQSLGWEPRKFTPAGAPATDKDTLQDVLTEMGDKYAEVKYLADYNIVADRHQKAEKWLSLVKEDKRVHGRINPIGAGTHRCSHYDDNMANIASVQVRGLEKTTFKEETSKDPMQLNTFEKVQGLNRELVFLHYDKTKEEVEVALTGREGLFGWESRSCWSVPKGKVLLGCDAAGIQLRALAHYMGDPEYTRKLLKEDIHVVNQHAAGLPTRKKAKTFIYSFLLGAGDEKTGELVGVSPEEYDDLFKWAELMSAPWGRDSLLKYVVNSLRRQGRQATKRRVAIILKGHKVKLQFMDRTPALKRLKTVEIPEVTRQGYLIGLDGRKLWIPNEHLALSLYLQGFEAVVMKLAMDLYHKKANKAGIPFKQVAMVHDEVQIETEPECAEELGHIVVSSFQKAGELLKTKCPIDADFRIGKNWAQTH